MSINRLAAIALMGTLATGCKEPKYVISKDPANQSRNEIKSALYLKGRYDKNGYNCRDWERNPWIGELAEADDATISHTRAEITAVVHCDPVDKLPEGEIGSFDVCSDKDGNLVLYIITGPLP